MNKKNRNSFSGSLGFVLAAAGSAVGLGNIWRFPYLAARDGGGLFLLIYILLAVTFGFTLLITEVAIGRRSQQGPLTAYKFFNPKWAFLGWLSFVVPYIIYPYYCVIGGWVLKYFATYLSQWQGCRGRRLLLKLHNVAVGTADTHGYLRHDVFLHSLQGSGERYREIFTHHHACIGYNGDIHLYLFAVHKPY